MLYWLIGQRAKGSLLHKMGCGEISRARDGPRRWAGASNDWGEEALLMQWGTRACLTREEIKNLGPPRIQDRKRDGVLHTPSKNQTGKGKGGKTLTGQRVGTKMRGHRRGQKGTTQRCTELDRGTFC